MSYLDTDNLALEIKYIFLNFAQGYFAEPVSRYVWYSNPRTTNIIIADKFAVDIGVASRRPAIILSRGNMGWTYAVRGQYEQMNPLASDDSWGFGSLDPPALDENRFRGQRYTDLLQAGIIYNVISKQGVEAEDIANKLFVALTAHKQALRKIGIFKFNSMNISQEQLLKYKGDVELYGVSVSTSFLVQKHLFQADKDFNCRVWVDGIEQYENIHYRVLPSGTQIKFFSTQDASAIVTMNFVDAVTLATRTGVILTTTDYQTYTIPNGWAIYGYYKIVDAIIVDVYGTYKDDGLNPLWSGVYYTIDEGLANGSTVGNPLLDDQSYWHRILAGEFSLDTGQEREYTYTLTSGNIDSAFAMDSLTAAITVNDSTVLDYDVYPTFSLTAHCEDEDGEQVVDDIIITVNLNDI